jgi:membrane protease YdiL (CAAX protease family)
MRSGSTIPVSTSNPSDKVPGTVVLTGSWERGGRSPAAAAVFGLLIVGVVYLHGQSLLALAGMLVAGGFGGAATRTGDLLRDLEQSARLTRTPVQVALVLSQVFLMLGPTLWLVRRWHSRNVGAYVRLRGASAEEMMLAVIAAMLFLPANAWLSELFVRELGIPDKLIEINEILFTPSGVPELVWLIVVVGVTPAVCEEVLFRGYAQRTLERVIGWKSILVVGTLFGLYHMQPLGLLSLSGLGFLFGFLFYRSKSLLPSIAAHFTNNTFVVILLFVGGSPTASGTTGWETALAALVLEIPVLLLYLKITRPTPEHTG